MLRPSRSTSTHPLLPYTAPFRSELTNALTEVPARVAELLNHDAHLKAIAEQIAQARDVLFRGRGSSYPIALEGALKLKEISYIHAEGYAAGEMKHGPTIGRAHV